MFDVSEKLGEKLDDLANGSSEVGLSPEAEGNLKDIFNDDYDGYEQNAEVSESSGDDRVDGGKSSIQDFFEDDYDEGDVRSTEESKEEDAPNREYTSVDDLFSDDYKESTKDAFPEAKPPITYENGNVSGEETESGDVDNDDVNQHQNDLDQSNESSIDDKNAQNEAESVNDVYDSDGTRELSDEEKKDLMEKTGWSEKKVDEKCRIDKDGVIHYKTDCQDKEGQTSESGVPYVRKTIEYKGVEIEGVFPEFDSVFDTELSEDDYQSSSCKQFNECNKKLKEAVENDPDLKDQFTEEQQEDIENGRTPRGYTWHHNEEPGKMQLVKTEDHDRRVGGAAHTGGNSIWGNKSVDKSNEDDKKKGESF